MDNEDLNNDLRSIADALIGIPYEEDDFIDFNAELKNAAWNILHENPGIEFGDWKKLLLSQYPAEVVDALGSDPEDVFRQLSEWWCGMAYEDPATGMCHSFQVWSEYFATDRSVEMYDMLVEAKKDKHFITDINTK